MYMRFPEADYSIAFGGENLDAVRRNLEDRIGSLLHAREWPPRLNSYCRYCALRIRCPAFRQAIAVVPESLPARELVTFSQLLVAIERLGVVAKAVDPVEIVPLIVQGKGVLIAINKQLGLGMDDQDIDMYYDLFVHILKRNPTLVELCQLGQANSEHSRHGFFKGQLVIDGTPVKSSLMDIIKKPWLAAPGNSLIAFCDDSSAIRGRSVVTFSPEAIGHPVGFTLRERIYHPTLTAETHNFPSGVAPYPGATTGTGGRIRDNQAVGCGGFVVAGGVVCRTVHEFVRNAVQFKHYACIHFDRPILQAVQTL